MKHKVIWGFLAALGLLGLSACNYPGVTAPTPFVFPTPNLTLTAVFNPTSGIPPGSPVPVVITATPSPTQAGEQATSTSIPAATPVPPTATLELPTAAPTSTPAATQSSEGPDRRPKYSLSAFYMDQPPDLDGNFDEWDVERYSITDVVFGADKWKNSDDLSANLMLGWDEDNLYLAVRVHDDVYAQNGQGEDIFKGDSLEILVDNDVSGDYYVKSLDEDDYQLGISPGSPEPGEDASAYLWYPSDEEGNVGDVEIAAKQLDDGYRVEVAIPWSDLNIDPASGDHYGFAFSVSDNDNTNKNIQQSMISSDPVRMLTDPTTWGDLTLTKP
jgi:hypothetical protein